MWPKNVAYQILKIIFYVNSILADVEELPTPAPLVALIDKQAGVRVSSNDLASADRRGLLWLLDEEAIFPGATDESFVERLMLQYGQRGKKNHDL